MRKRWMAALVAATLVLPIGGFATVQAVTGNMYEVVPGVLYRSAQPNREQLTAWVTRYGIKTVINLRGASDKAWYADETAAARELGVEHIDFPLKASREVPVDRMAALVDLMAKAPKPLLIHCQAGADRSGLASALYMAMVEKVGVDEARGQLSAVYGHLPHYFNGTAAMDRSFDKMTAGVRAASN